MLTINIVLLICSIVAVHLPCILGVKDSLNFVLPAGKRECYFEDISADAPTRTIEAFIQSVGDIDVTMTLHGPLSLEVIRKGVFEDPVLSQKIDSTKEEESDSLTYLMDYTPTEFGTYAICLDNRNSRFLQKIVQLDVRLPTKTVPIVLKVNREDNSQDSSSEEYKLAEEAIARIHANMLKIQDSQLRDRHRLSLHSEINKASHSEVLQGSIIETACFIMASLFQLLFVRRWFAGKMSSQGGGMRA